VYLVDYCDTPVILTSEKHKTKTYIAL